MRFGYQVILVLSQVICCLFFVHFAYAQEDYPISITEVWAQPDGTFYMTLMSEGVSEIHLVEAQSSLTTWVDFPIDTIAANETPTQMRFKLVNLPEPLLLETAFQVVLTFEAETTFNVTVGVPVVATYPFQSKLWVEAGTTWMPPLVSEAGSIYFSLYNMGESEDHLVKVEVVGIGSTSLHETVLDDREVMRMRGLPEGISVIGGGEIVLKPGGYHIMLENIALPPEIGDTLFARLEFASGETIPIGIPVEDRAVPINVIDGATRPIAANEQHPYALIIVTIIATALLLILMLMRLTMTNGSAD